MKNALKSFTALLLILLSAGIGPAQNPGGYGSYYTRNLSNTKSRDPGTNRYLYDKYFYHNKNISPYLSAVRGGSDNSTAYYTSVLPEKRRRESAKQAQMKSVQQYKLQGGARRATYPSANSASVKFPSAFPSKPAKQSPSLNSYQSNPYYKQLYGR